MRSPFFGASSKGAAQAALEHKTTVESRFGNLMMDGWVRIAGLNYQNPPCGLSSKARGIGKKQEKSEIFA